jgi:DNA helicase-2/ATP-dependent DNA helicase PcrA
MQVDIKKQFLPKIAKFTPKKITPSGEQLAIQLATQKIILINANAGAAKTTTLALRIAESLARGVQPDDMIVLTVTDAARDVMRQRLKEIGVGLSLIKKIRFATFESFARDTLLAIERSAIALIDDNEQLIPIAIDALDAVCAKHGAHFALDTSTSNPALHAFFNMQLGIKSRLDLKTHDFEGYQPEEIAHVLNVPLTTYFWHLEYESLRGADDDIQFRGPFDASYDLIQMLEANPHLTAALPDYKTVICDELHDLNEVTFRLLTLLIRKSGAFFCGAGDKDQVIYSWTGADHQFLRSRFQQTFPYLAPYALTRCYRHGAALTSAVARFKNKDNESGVAFATKIALTHYAPDGCPAAVIAAVQQWLAGGGKLGGLAILLRNPSQSIQLESALIHTGLAYRTDGMPEFMQRLEILIFRGMMAVALQNLDTVRIKTVKEHIFDAMLIFAEINLDAASFATWKSDRDTAITQANALEWFLDGVLIRRSRNSAAAIAQCRDYLRTVDHALAAADVLQRVFEIMRLAEVTKRIFVDPQQASVVSQSIAQFIQMCRASGMNLQQFSDWIGATEWQHANQPAQDALTLACVDDVKGREFDCVIMPYLERGEFPRNRVDALEEENRFYVGITRTRLQLCLLAPEDEACRSGFIGRMGLAAGKGGE